MYIQMEFCDKQTLRSAIDEGLYKNTERVWRMFRVNIQKISVLSPCCSLCALILSMLCFKLLFNIKIFYTFTGTALFNISFHCATKNIL